MHVAYSCNMSCRGCVTVSDIPRDGVADFDDIVDSIAQWSQVLDPDWVVLFGGEPLMHPQIKELVLEVRRQWPNAKICIPTNALLLKKLFDKQWLEAVQPLEIRVALHKDNEEGRFFKQLIADFMKLFPDWKKNTTPISEGGGNWISTRVPYKFAYENPAGISIAINQNESFTVPYDINDTGHIAPFHSDPDKAFAHCVSPGTVYVYKNLLYKCFPYPNLQDTQSDFDTRWPVYKPYSATDDLTEYFANITHPHAICSMCPESGIVHHNDPKTVKILPKASWIEKQIKLNI